ncbi:MAG: hypothetical protein FJ279_16120 [Planctomycetes bacterium]|nr:hypothetical protein [Planctomycetota bacterium]
MTDPNQDDLVLASAARFLVDGGEEDAASLLLSCVLEFWPSGDTWFVGDETHEALHVKLAGPRAAYEVLKNPSHQTTQAIRTALEAVLPEKTYVKHFTAHVQQVPIDPNWREELLQIARGVGVHNQAAQGKALKTWNNLHFRSQSEVRIAQALDRAGVLFFPNCRGRLGAASTRENREADFLVCHDGKWGILEVDGEPFHPPARTAEDHARDRLFREHGVRSVEHFDATECYEKPDEVVGRFLRLLEKT